VTRYLSIVEGAYRATVEEQDDTGIWFSRAMHGAGATVTLLLCADAVGYAQPGHDASGLRLGTREVRVPPRLDQDLEAALARGIRVAAVKEDLRDRGIPERALLPGVEVLERAHLPALVAAHERVLHW
jgi:hypothetical protein